uniref:Uncharacterized protein n=1 Tax=Janibacter limosus TaxID=53458 RepID=A0AC61U5I1_9MICO|nr:hypothetical protein [Janibacter limosus]
MLVFVASPADHREGTPVQHRLPEFALGTAGLTSLCAALRAGDGQGWTPVIGVGLCLVWAVAAPALRHRVTLVVALALGALATLGALTLLPHVILRSLSDEVAVRHLVAAVGVTALYLVLARAVTSVLPTPGPGPAAGARRAVRAVGGRQRRPAHHARRPARRRPARRIHRRSGRRDRRLDGHRSGPAAAWPARLHPRHPRGPGPGRGERRQAAALRPVVPQRARSGAELHRRGPAAAGHGRRLRPGVGAHPTGDPPAPRGRPCGKPGARRAGSS